MITFFSPFFEYFFQIVFLIAPVVFAGVFFIVSLKRRWFGVLALPLDGGRTVRERRIFGENKTFRGLVVMPLGTMVFVALGAVVVQAVGMEERILFDYSFQSLGAAFVFGLAYSLGELPNSFVKRQLGISPGGAASGKFLRFVFRFIDIFDSVVACGLVLFFLFSIPGVYVLGAVLLGGVVHVFTDFLMKLCRLK